MKRFLWLVVALATMVLFGCKEDVKKPGKETVVGIWESYVWMLENDALMHLTISEDGTFVITIDEDESAGTWVKTEDGCVLTASADNSQIDFVFPDDSGTKMVTDMGYGIPGVFFRTGW